MLGALAQLVARNVRNVEVRGSNPLCSTKHNKRIADGYPFVFLVKSRGDLKGTARQGKKASSGWLFSSPGWRQDCPNLAGNPLCSTKHNKRSYYHGFKEPRHGYAVVKGENRYCGGLRPVAWKRDRSGFGRSQRGHRHCRPVYANGYGNKALDRKKTASNAQLTHATSPSRARLKA